MSESVYLGIGSNLFDRERNIFAAIDLIKKSGTFTFSRMASIYESPPLYNTNQPDFLNTVIKGTYSKEPQHLLDEIQSVELQLGRPARREKNAPRIIDIDIILFGDRDFEQETLVIPHPKLAERKFVLEPLSEIAPDFLIPKFDKTPVELAAVCPDESMIEKQTAHQPA